MGILQPLFGGSSQSITAVPGWQQFLAQYGAQPQTGLGAAGQQDKSILKFFGNSGNGQDYSNAPGFGPEAAAINSAAQSATTGAARSVAQRTGFEASGNP